PAATTWRAGRPSGCSRRPSTRSRAPFWRTRGAAERNEGEMTEAARLWIDGKEEGAEDGRVIETENPATGAVLATLARGGRADVGRAVASARRSFETGWGRLGVHVRARILWKAGEILGARGEELARLEAVDTGKPIANARRVDVPRAADAFFYF